MRQELSQSVFELIATVNVESEWNLRETVCVFALELAVVAYDSYDRHLQFAH
jgi:hypothetical protein